MAMYGKRNNHQGLRHYSPYDHEFRERLNRLERKTTQIIQEIIQEFGGQSNQLERKAKQISDCWREINAEFDRSRKAAIRDIIDPKAQKEREKASLDKLYSLLELDEYEKIITNDTLKTQTQKDMSTFYANLNQAEILGYDEIPDAKILYRQPLKKAIANDASNISELLFSIANYLSTCSSDRHLKPKKSVHPSAESPSAASPYKSKQCTRTRE
jgi:hypothetical protein